LRNLRFGEMEGKNRGGCPDQEEVTRVIASKFPSPTVAGLPRRPPPAPCSRCRMPGRGHRWAPPGGRSSRGELGHRQSPQGAIASIVLAVTFGSPRYRRGSPRRWLQRRRRKNPGIGTGDHPGRGQPDTCAFVRVRVPLRVGEGARSPWIRGAV
jgi:hypothetical protein